MKWEPIETTPNEVAILVYRDDGSIELVPADDNDYRWIPYTWTPKRGIAHPTHWMPLPPPPEAA